MPSNTPRLNLYKKDPATDGSHTFDIKLMLNDNWDKIDADVAKKADLDAHIADTNNPHNVTAAQIGAETPAGAQAKVDAHANRTDNPHNVTAAQVGAAPASHVGSGGTAHAVATTSSAGFMSAADKSKLDGIQSGAEVNQFAFSNVLVGGTTIAADSKTDTLELVAGTGITLTPDATNDKVTIAASGVQIATGIWSDTTTVIAGGGTYQKTFALPFAAKVGQLQIRGYNASYGALAFFDTTQNNSFGLSIWSGANYSEPTEIRNKASDSRLGSANELVNFGAPNAGVSTDAGIHLKDAYISGTNLIVIFENTASGINKTLGVTNLFWQVIG